MTDAGSSPAAFAGPPADMPIPARLNVAITITVVVAAIALLSLGSRVQAWYAVLAVGVAFSYVLLTNYALLHEASHGNRSEEHTSELQSLRHLVCRLLLEK